MDCRRAKTCLPLYGGGELRWWRRSSVRRHLQNCPGCRAELARINRARAVVSEAILEASIVDPSDSVVDDVMRNVRAESPPRTSETRRVSRWRLVVAPAAVAAVVALLILTLPGERPEIVSVSDERQRPQPPDHPPVVERIEGEGSKIVHFETDSPGVTIAWIFEPRESGEKEK